MNEEITFTEGDYPGLYQAADTESKKSQQIYYRCLCSYLGLLILGVIIALFLGDSKLLAIISAASFLGALSICIFLAAKRHDRKWYTARAVAESVKTRTWRYMMRAEPYDCPDIEARKFFLSDLQLILIQNREVTKELSGESATHDAINIKMELIKSMDLQTRKSIYKKLRIENQLNWYSLKAVINKKQNRKYFILLVAVNIMAVVCVILRVAFPSWKYLPTQVFAVGAASIVSWLQAKRFGDLSTSYSLAAHEISIISALADDTKTEEDFSRFVSDTENAFSREHTQWVARRDI
ncbi:MAG: DUF4231 domain-containing protein [Deltaproteobacteria bacterium]|nr:DUF4231 domain-containing protein [Deltaproteobacteria bacterium]